MDAGEIGITAARKCAQQVERRRRLSVGQQQPLRIGHARFGRERDVVDDVAAVRRQRHAVDGLGIRRAGLCELAGDPPDLQHRLAGAMRQNDRHLQEDAEEIADVVGAVLGKALRAIAALQQERLASRDLGQL